MKTMRLIMTIAWRNLWRSKRRTVLTLMTILVGCAMIILINGFGKGGHDKMIDDAVGLSTGHIQIHESGFWENMTIDYAFVPEEELMKSLDAIPGIRGYAPRIHAGGLLATDGGTRGVAIQGIDPAREKAITNLHTKVLPQGRFLEPGDENHAVIGSLLAKNINAAVGNTIAVISQGFDGSIAAEHLTVVGIIKSGSPMFDRELVLIPIQAADEIFSMMGFVHSIAVSVTDPGLSSTVASAIQRIVHGRSDNLEVLDWPELMPELVQYIEMDNIGGYIFDVILFLVVAFGVLNTIQMSVFERTREFGIMLSIGTRPGTIAAMILVETMVIALMGIFLGGILGSSIGWYFLINPIDYSQYAEEVAVWGFTTTEYPAVVTWLNVLVTSILTFTFSVLFSLFPAKRASELNPVESIRRL